ncbi:GATA transcription factor 16 [Linum perenne]
MEGSLVFREKEREEEGKKKKSCSDCKATSTPLWRCGPAGPKSLCNACGIRYTKKIRPDKKRAKSPPHIATSSSAAVAATTSAESTSATTNTAEPTGPFKLRVVYSGNGGGVTISRSPLPPAPAAVKKKQRCERRKIRKLMKEEEEAAFCLMALSCGSIFA